MRKNGVVHKGVAEHIVDGGKGEHIVLVVGGGIVCIAHVVARRKVQGIEQGARHRIRLFDGQRDGEIALQRDGDLLPHHLVFVFEFGGVLRDGRGHGIGLCRVLLRELRGGALRIHADAALFRTEIIDGGEGVLRHLLGRVAGEEVDAHHAVGHVRKGDLRPAHVRLAVLYFKFEHPAEEHVLLPVALPKGGDALCRKGALRVHEDDVAHVLRKIVIGEGVYHFVGGHPDARREPDAHQDHQHDGDKARRVTAEHPSESL